MAKKDTEFKQDEVKAEPVVDKFTKDKILAAQRYSNRRDVLGVILDDKKEYSTAEVDDILDKFMKGKVN